MTNNSPSYGANIRCSVCGAMPYPTDPAVRECFDLRRVNSAGEFSASPAPGVWLCPEHAPTKQPTARRAIQGTPLEAVAEFERLFADEASRLVEALPGDDDDNRDDAKAAFDDFRREIERGLGQLKEVVALHVKPPASNAPKPRRSRQKAMTARERNVPGQISLIEEEPIRDTS